MYKKRVKLPTQPRSGSIIRTHRSGTRERSFERRTIAFGLLQLFLVVAVVFVVTGGITVTLEDYSGEFEPQWKILPSNPSYNKIEQLLGEARKHGFVYGSAAMPARLGFKGFLLEDTKMKPKEELIVGPNTVPLQELLLQTMPAGLVSNSVRQIILKEIRSGKVTPDVGVEKLGVIRLT